MLDLAKKWGAIFEQQARWNTLQNMVNDRVARVGSWGVVVVGDVGGFSDVGARHEIPFSSFCALQRARITTNLVALEYQVKRRQIAGECSRAAQDRFDAAYLEVEAKDHLWAR